MGMHLRFLLIQTTLWAATALQQDYAAIAAASPPVKCSSRTPGKWDAGTKVMIVDLKAARGQIPARSTGAVTNQRDDTSGLLLVLLDEGGAVWVEPRGLRCLDAEPQAAKHSADRGLNSQQILSTFAGAARDAAMMWGQTQFGHPSNTSLKRMEKQVKLAGRQRMAGLVKTAQNFLSNPSAVSDQDEVGRRFGDFMSAQKKLRENVKIDLEQAYNETSRVLGMTGTVFDLLPNSAHDIGDATKMMQALMELESTQTVKEMKKLAEKAGLKVSLPPLPWTAESIFGDLAHVDVGGVVKDVITKALGMNSSSEHLGTVNEWLRAFRNESFVMRTSAYSKSLSSVVDLLVDGLRQKMSGLLITTAGKSPVEITKLLGQFFTELISLAQFTRDKLGIVQTDFLHEIPLDIAQKAQPLSGSYVAQIGGPIDGLVKGLEAVAGYQGPTGDKFCVQMLPFMQDARLAAETGADGLYKTLSELKGTMPMLQNYVEATAPDMTATAMMFAGEIIDMLERLAVPLVDLRTVLVENLGELTSKSLNCAWSPMKHRTEKGAHHRTKKHAVLAPLQEFPKPPAPFELPKLLQELPKFFQSPAAIQPPSN